MAWTAKLTVSQGKPYSGDVAIAAGSSEAARETISINIDADKLTKGEALLMLENAAAAISAGPWPIN